MMKIWLLLISLIAINPVVNIARANTMEQQSLPDITAFQRLIDDLKQRFPNAPTNPLIIVSSSEQKLFLIQDNKVIESHLISTATAGLGNQSGSNKTPLGVHQVSEKFGKDAKAGTIFKARMNTQRVAKILPNPNEKSTADNVTSRILWLSGMEKGINKGGKVDSKSRFIYIHGTDEEGRLGKPASHGCIRMKNQAVIALFDRVPLGTIVDIIE
ncbi:MAG: L,D-transpeptidase [Cocleimonas sp.]